MHLIALARRWPLRQPLVKWGWGLAGLPLLLAACTGAPALPPQSTPPLSSSPPSLGQTPPAPVATPPPAAGGLMQVPPGEWGGEHAGLSSTGTGGQFRIDCDSGAIAQPLTLDAAGTFDLPGTYTWCPAACFLNLPAKYTGHSDRSTLTVQIAWTDPQGQAKTSGPFQLTLGAPPHLLTDCPK